MKSSFKRAMNTLGIDIIRAAKVDVPGATADGVATYQIEIEVLECHGDRYFVPRYALRRPAAKALLAGTLYEPDTHRFVEGFCSAIDGSIVHAGTFFGDMIPKFSQYVSGHVYAFEPVLESYVLARLCVDRNELENVILMNCALSADIENLRVSTEDVGGFHAGGSSSVSNEGHLCSAIDIDRLEIEDLVLIQLDVEGHELSALTGALGSIERNRPVIAIEDNEGTCGQLLGGLNYRMAGTVPGLEVWLPSESVKYQEVVAPLLDRIGSCH